MRPELLKREREKYERMWETGEYQGSRGARVAPIAWEWFSDLGCTSLTDWGCKHGKAMEWFLEAGANEVRGIDLIEVAPSDLNVVSAPLSSPGELPATDFAFSADVLEHLPPEEVRPSLEAMRERTVMGGWLQIATRPDSCGSLIGETLHLTVKPPVWWRARVGEYFEVVKAVTRKGAVQLWLRAE